MTVTVTVTVPVPVPVPVPVNTMRAKLSWNCDFCGKAEIVMSTAGILYCNNCRMSYGENINGAHNMIVAKEHLWVMQWQVKTIKL